jgi:hypothetical protein
VWNLSSSSDAGPTPAPLRFSGRGFRGVKRIILTIPTLVLPLVAGLYFFPACEVAECLRHSDCDDGESCVENACEPDGGGGSTGGADDSGPTAGVGDCEGYTFEAPSITLSDWACDPITSPKDFALPYALPPLDIVPIYTAGPSIIAGELHYVGVCQGGGSPMPEWDLARVGFAESVWQSCMSYLTTHPICGAAAGTSPPITDICDEAAALYYFSIGSVPPLVQVPGMELPSGPCEGGVEFVCGGGADESGG